MSCGINKNLNALIDRAVRTLEDDPDDPLEWMICDVLREWRKNPQGLLDNADRMLVKYLTTHEKDDFDDSIIINLIVSAVLDYLDIREAHLYLLSHKPYYPSDIRDFYNLKHKEKLSYVPKRFY